MYDIYGNAKVTGNYGEKRSYYKPGKSHEGDDIALAMNSPINSRLSGTVLSVKSDPNGYGNYVDIDHGNGIITRYAHANSFNVKPGQLVKEGEQIGLVGSTGRSSGPHLHTELIINGVKHNPRELEEYMANLLSSAKPKGTPKAPVLRDTDNLINDIANQYVDDQKAAAQVQEQDPFRETINEYIKSKIMEPVEIPKYTELKDVLSAAKGDKLGVFADFLKNPQTIRTIGNLFGGTYMDRKGNFVHGLENQALKEEELMKQAQQEALAEAHQQSALIGNVYNAFNQKDLADLADARARDLARENREFQREENAITREQNQQKMDLEEKKLDALIEHNKAMEEIAKDKVAANNKQEKQLQKNQEALNNLNAITNQLDRFVDSFEDVNNPYRYRLAGWASEKGNFLTPEEANFNSQRTLLFNKIARDLGGEKGVLSDQDIKRIEQSLPTLSDTKAQKKAKMQAIYNLLDDRKQQYGGAISTGLGNQTNNDPLGLGL